MTDIKEPRLKVRNAKTTAKLLQSLKDCMWHNENLSTTSLEGLSFVKDILEWQLGAEETDYNKWIFNLLDEKEPWPLTENNVQLENSGQTVLPFIAPEIDFSKTPSNKVSIVSYNFTQEDDGA